MLHRLAFAWPAVLALVCGVAVDARAAPLSGRFDSPMGTIDVREQKDGDIVGRLVDAKTVCGQKKGAVVLSGSRLDDSVVGNLRVCKTGTGCSGEANGAVMLLITKGGSVLSGAVHVDGKCTTNVGGDSIVLRRPTATKPAKTVAPQNARHRAEAVARAAFSAFQADGNAEAARGQFLAALKLDPTYAEGAVGVGMTYFVRERYDEALTWYKRALEENPALGDAYYNTACVYAVKGDKAQSLRYLRIALLNGYVQLDTLSTDPDLKPLAGDVVFEAFKRGDLDVAAPAPATTAEPSPPTPSDAGADIDRPAQE